MKQNKVQKENAKYAPTTSLLDENNKPLEFEFKHIGTKENEAIRDACTTEVQITGKPNLFRPKVDTSKYIAKMICATIVYPDMYDAELQDSYGVKTPEDLLYAMIDDAGEYQALTVWVQNFLGLTKSFEEKVDEAKN